jgi:hypothetical protein
MLKRTIVSFVCLSLILSTFAFAAPPTKAWTEKTVSAQTGPLAQYQGQMVKLSEERAAIAYFSNRDTNQGLSLLSFLGGGDEPTYDVFVRIVDKYGRTIVTDKKITTNAVKPTSYEILDALDYLIKTNTFNMVADGQGGVLVCYTAYDSGKGATTLWAQRMSGAGALMWGVKDGVATPVQLSASNPRNARIVPDGAGGAYVSWLYSGWNGMNTVHYGRVQRIDPTGLLVFNSATIPSGGNTNVINDFEIASVPKAPNASAGNVYVAWSQTDSMNNKAVVRGAVLDPTFAYKWGDPSAKQTEVILLAQDLTYYKDLSLAGDANGMVAASNKYDQNSYLYQVSFQRTDYDAGNLLWNDDNGGTWGQSISLASQYFTSIADSPALLPDGSGGVWAAYWDFDGDSNYNQLKLSGINSDKSQKTIVNLQKVSGYAGMTKLVADTDGGITAFWADGRNAGRSGSSAFDIYAQRVKDGAIVYPANGKNLTLDTGFKVLPSAVFMEDRYFMIYSKCIDTAYPSLNLYGIYYSQFAPDGTLAGVSASSSPLIDDQGPVANSLPHGVRTSDGRTLVAWNDTRNGYPQVFANILDKNGNKTIADIAFQKSVLDLAAWPFTALTPDGKYAWVVWTGYPFDPNIMRAMSPGMLSPRPLNALQAKTQAKQVQAKIGMVMPRFYANKIALATGSKVFAEDLRIGSGYFGLEALPAIAATDTGGLALAYGTITGLMGGIGNAAVNAQKATPRRSQPSFGMFPRTGISAKAEMQNSSIYLKVINSDGSFISGQSPNTTGIPLTDPVQTPLVFERWVDLAPALINSGDGYLTAVWMRLGNKMRANAVKENPSYLLYGQRISQSDWSLSYPTGTQLTAATANKDANDTEVHANPSLACRNGKIGLTWDNMLVNSNLGYTKARIDALVAGMDANGPALLWGPTAVTAQKTAYYDAMVDPEWSLDLYPSIKFLNDRLESVVSWQDYNQVAYSGMNAPGGGWNQAVKAKGQVGGDLIPSSPTILSSGVYAMHLDATGKKLLSAPFAVISSADKAVALPVAIDNQNNCSLSYAATTFNIGGTGATQLNFGSLLLAFISAVYGNSALVTMQNVGFILPATPTNFTLAPAGDAVSLNVAADFSGDNSSDCYVYDLAGNLVGVIPFTGNKIEGVIHNNLLSNTIYQLKLATFNDAGLSVFTPMAQACTYAEGVTGFAALANVFSWNAAAYNPGLTRYEFARKIAGSSSEWEILSGRTFAEASGNTSYTDTTMLPNQTYNYRVRPYNQLGNINPEGPMLTASLTKSAPAIDKIKLSHSGQQGMTIRSGMYVGDDLLVKIVENNPGGIITQIQVKFTETATGRSYTWTSAAGVTAATTDGYVTIPVNIPKGVYNMEITTLNDSGLTATKSITIRKDDVARVVDNFIAMVSLPSGQAVQASAAGSANFATISYQLTKDAPVTLRIVDVGGQVLMSRVIASGLEGAHVGYNMVNWDGLTLDGGKPSRGLKMIQMVIGGRTVTAGAMFK